MPQPEYPYLSISVFLVKVTAPNKQFFSVGSLLLEVEPPNKQHRYLLSFYEYM